VFQIEGDAIVLAADLAGVPGLDFSYLDQMLAHSLAACAFSAPQFLQHTEVLLFGCDGELLDHEALLGCWVLDDDEGGEDLVLFDAELKVFVGLFWWI
jgi:hypothetical protein